MGEQGMPKSGMGEQGMPKEGWGSREGMAGEGPGRKTAGRQGKRMGAEQENSGSMGAPGRNATAAWDER